MFFFREKGIESKKQHIFFCEREQQQQTSVFHEFFFFQKNPTFESLKISQVYQRYDALQRMGSLGDQKPCWEKPTNLFIRP